jgi:hypothetical protein
MKKTVHHKSLFMLVRKNWISPINIIFRFTKHNHESVIRKLFSLILLIIVAQQAFAQNYNIALKKELDSLYHEDQQWRELISDEIFQTKQDSIAQSLGVPKNKLLVHVLSTMNKTDSLNMLRIDQIIAQHGYPGLSLVGKGTNEAVFFIIQHSNKIDVYLPIIKKAALGGELAFMRYAMMLDRSLMYANKPQIYGTQGKGLSVKDKATGAKKFIQFIWPIQNPAKVNQLRKKAGINTTVEQGATEMGIAYQVLTMDDVKKMQE